MNKIKEIFKVIFWFASLVAASTFLTFISINIESKTEGLIIMFSGLWIICIILYGLAVMLWGENKNE